MIAYTALLPEVPPWWFYVIYTVQIYVLGFLAGKWLSK